MDDPLFMCSFDAHRDLTADFQRVLQRKRPLCQLLRQRFPFNKFQHEEALLMKVVGPIIRQAWFPKHQAVIQILIFPMTQRQRAFPL